MQLDHPQRRETNTGQKEGERSGVDAVCPDGCLRVCCHEHGITDQVREKCQASKAVGRTEVGVVSEEEEARPGKAAGTSPTAPDRGDVISRVALPRRRAGWRERRLEALWLMTSLFRRSGGASHHGDVDNEGVDASPDKQDSSHAGGRQVRRLEFSQAMEDFQTMFPDMEQEVIECVLRANNGAVDPTIDQLLQMSLGEHDSDDTSDSDDSVSPEVLERTLEPEGSDEEPPPIYSPPPYAMHIYDRKYPDDPMPTPPPRFDAQPPSSQRPVGSYRNWNPPLLGTLPDDFLRILPQQLYSLPRSQSNLTQRSSSSSLSSLSSASQPAEPGAAPGQVGMEIDQGMSLKQYLEDERIALFLQNEEFMRELQRNREFLIALEKALHAGLPGHAVLEELHYESLTSRSSQSPTVIWRSKAGDNCASGTAETCTTISDEALLRDKLKHMGKSTRKKLFELARVFSEKTRGRKTKKRTLLKHQSPGHAASTANLLEDEEGLLSGDGSKLRGLGTQEEEVSQQEVLS